jgi:amino acid transporter/nucleotide-binding universal stress UspA family protein
LENVRSTSSSDTSSQELARDLGFLEAYTIGVGTMIGAGIFVLPGIVANNAGPAGMISFLIGGAVSLLTALSLSELATGMPRAGGSHYYVNTALGSFFGSVVGWSMWAGLMFATAFYMLGFGQYLTYFWGNVPVAGAALAMAALLIGVNYRGVKEAGSLQNLIVILLIGFVLVFLAVGVFNIDWGTFRPFNPNGWGAVASTAATVYVTFIGFEVIATSAEEIKNPGRNLPLSMIASVLTPTVFYVLVMLVSTGVLPVATLAESYIPVADVATQYLGTAGVLMMVVGAVLATVSSANASILSAARVNFAMGRDNILTSWLNEIHPDHRTPYRAILVTGGVILALIAIGVGIETLADVASFAYLVTYALVHVAVFVMRRADPEPYDPDFKLKGWAYPVVPLLGFLSCVVIVAQMRPIVIAIGGAILLIGMAWYLAYARTRAVKPSLVGEAIAAKERPAPPSGRFRVVIPVANPNTERFLLRLGAAIASGHADANGREAELIAVSVIEVPQQTSLQQGIQYEEERVERQQELLKNARDMAEDLGIGIRTRAIVGRSVGDVVLDVIEEERASHVVLGWGGQRKRYQHVLGTNIDPIVEETSCELTLVKKGPTEEVGEVIALIGTGPYTRLAARRAAEFSRSDPAAGLTLLNVQRPSEDGTYDPEEEGRALIESVAKEAGIERDYEEEVIVTDEDIRETLLDGTSVYDTICVGATRSTTVAQALFGSIPEEIGEKSDDTVAIARGSVYKPRSVTRGLIDWLSG